MGDDEKHNGGAAGAGALMVDQHNHKKTSRYSSEDTRRTISTVIVAILLIAAITALVLWLVYRPHNPRFTVVGAAVNSPTTIQFTVVTRNPNNRVSIYYDYLAVFLSYRDQAITPPLMLPPLHHGSDSTVVVSPMLPVAPEVVNGLGSEGDNYGAVSLRVVFTGKLRWKAGGVKTGRKRLYVACDVMVGLKSGALGQVPLLGPSVCKVHI